MMLKKYYSPKVHRYLPDFHLFAFFSEESFPAGMGKIFIVRYKEKIIGGSVCLFSDDTAYLMFSAGMRKSYPLLYPARASWAQVRRIINLRNCIVASEYGVQLHNHPSFTQRLLAQINPSVSIKRVAGAILGTVLEAFHLPFR